jgi:hypothetical protein
MLNAFGKPFLSELTNNRSICRRLVQQYLYLIAMNFLEEEEEFLKVTI